MEKRQGALYFDREEERYNIRFGLEECYHGMEYYLLERMDWNSEMANTAYFEEMRKWKLNDNRYISGRDEGDSFEAYQSQPLEASAKKYASSETEALIHFIAVYGDE